MSRQAVYEVAQPSASTLAGLKRMTRMATARPAAALRAARRSSASYLRALRCGGDPDSYMPGHEVWRAGSAGVGVLGWGAAQIRSPARPTPQTPPSQTS